jgi:acetolactate synthase-1/2/3 large subunit
MKMTGGQALAHSLRIEGIDTLFTLPGIQLDYFFDALWEIKDEFTIFHTRHEQATGYMADGYSRSTGKPSGFIVVPGPGVLNTTAALSTSYACSSPVVCITGQIDSHLIDQGVGALHEINDQVGLLAHLTKLSERGEAPGEIPAMMRRASRAIQEGRPRPVSVEVSPDVLATVADVTLLEPETINHRNAADIDSDLIEEAAKLLGNAESPVICAGGGVLTAEAWEEVNELSEILGAPVLMTSNGRGIVDERTPRGLSGRFPTNELVPNADAIFAVGTRFSMASNMGLGGGVTVTGKLIQCDVDRYEIGRNYPAEIALQSDAKLTTAALCEALRAHNKKRVSRDAELSDLKDRQTAGMAGMTWQAGMSSAIREVLPEDGIVVSESTQVGYFIQGGGFPVYKPRSFFTSGYQGTLGYGYPTALGVQIGNPDKVVVSVNGDGGFMYNVQELSTQAQYDIPLITLVFNDGLFGNVRRIQEQKYNGHSMSTDLNNPDFAALAELFGVTGYQIQSAEELKMTLSRAIADRKPALIEVQQPRTPDLASPFPMQQEPPRPVVELI